MIKTYFKQFNLFTSDEIDQIAATTTSRKLSKNEYFIKEGQYCKEVAFINSGIFRSWHTSENGDDLTYCFRFPNNLIAAYSSFITGGPSQENIQAITNAELLVISKHDLDALALKITHWDKFLKIIAEQNYIELEDRLFSLQRDNASTRYKRLMQEHPDYIQYIPLQFLASYLGITQRHLSRIRSELKN